jgi:L-alanine-DL-glutamate epimerase-like enolase superfamily enzyme
VRASRGRTRTRNPFAGWRGIGRSTTGAAAARGTNVTTTDLKCAVLGRNPVVRIVTDAGLSGYAAVESWKPYLKPHVLALRDELIGLDPTDVERVMLRIRRHGAFKPWGSAVSVRSISRRTSSR